MLLACAAVVAAAAGNAYPQGFGDGDWPMAARDYANTRFSPLRDIDVANVKQLQIASTFSTGVVRGHEAAPIVVRDTMYVVTPYPNVLYALDLSQPGGPIKWKVEPKPLAAAQGIACCDVVNRGAAPMPTAACSSARSITRRSPWMRRAAPSWGA